MKFIFALHWLSRKERGLGYPPCSIGMKVQMGTVWLEVSLHPVHPINSIVSLIDYKIELPKTFKHACSIDPATYRDFWRALRTCAPFERLSSKQKDVIRGTLATACFFCDDTITTCRHWPPFCDYLLKISQLAGEHGVPREDLFWSLATWARLHFPVSFNFCTESLCANLSFFNLQEALNTVQWEADNN